MPLQLESMANSPLNDGLIYVGSLRFDARLMVGNKSTAHMRVSYSHLRHFFRNCRNRLHSRPIPDTGKILLEVSQRVKVNRECLALRTLRNAIKIC